MAQKKRVSSGPHKNHGPKRKLFHCYSRSMRLALGKAGILSKYDNFESFELAVAARGFRGDTKELWRQFFILPTRADKDAFLKNLRK